MIRDSLFRNGSDGSLSVEIETGRPTFVHEPSTNSIRVRPPIDSDLCPKVAALLRQLNGTSSSTDHSHASLIENETTQPMTSNPAFGSVFAPTVELTSAIDAVTMSTNHVQPPSMQTTTSPSSTALPQPMIPSVAGARAMRSFAITPKANDKSSLSPHTDKVPILGLGTLFNGGSLRRTPNNRDGSLLPSDYNEKKSQTPTTSNRPQIKSTRNGDINVMPSGHFRKQRSKKWERNDDEYVSWQSIYHYLTTLLSCTSRQFAPHHIGEHARD